MNIDIIKSQLTNWMINFVETPHPSLGNWAPCPYARSARLNDKISIIESDIVKLEETVTNCLSTLDIYDVVIVCFDHTQISVHDCELLVHNLNNILMPKNYVILEDHPDHIEEIAGVIMNFGYCGLLIISKLDKLNHASEQLKRSGYYDSWSTENLDDVVNWRFD